MYYKWSNTTFVRTFGAFQVVFVLPMHLYLRDSPVRTLILSTSSEDERQGCPRRVLVFRVGQSKSSSQAIVEFVPKDEVEFAGVVRLTARPVYGVLGLINIANGTYHSLMYLI